MAQRKRNITIRSYGASNALEVWTDLTDEQIEQIEGVTSIRGEDLVGSRVVYTDPRYDIEDIKAEIEALADTQKEKA